MHSAADFNRTKSLSDGGSGGRGTVVSQLVSSRNSPTPEINVRWCGEGRRACGSWLFGLTRGSIHEMRTGLPRAEATKPTQGPSGLCGKRTPVELWTLAV